MEHHEIAAIQGANDKKEPQGGDGNKLPLRLFIYAGGYSAGRRGLSAGGGRWNYITITHSMGEKEAKRMEI